MVSVYCTYGIGLWDFSTNFTTGENYKNDSGKFIFKLKLNLIFPPFIQSENLTDTYCHYLPVNISSAVKRLLYCQFVLLSVFNWRQSTAACTKIITDIDLNPWDRFVTGRRRKTQAKMWGPGVTDSRTIKKGTRNKILGQEKCMCGRGHLRKEIKEQCLRQR